MGIIQVQHVGLPGSKLTTDLPERLRRTPSASERRDIETSFGHPPRKETFAAGENSAEVSAPNEPLGKQRGLFFAAMPERLSANERDRKSRRFLPNRISRRRRGQHALHCHHPRHSGKTHALCAAQAYRLKPHETTPMRVDYPSMTRLPFASTAEDAEGAEDR
jgi:hypothetical protein